MNRFFGIIIILLSSVFSGVYANLPYDFSSTRAIPIELAPMCEFSTDGNITEGSEVRFFVRKDVYDGEKRIVHKGDMVTARLETLVTSGMNGFPAEILIDNFEIPGVKKSQLLGNFTKIGQNRCLWVYPLKWSLTLIPFVGSLTNLIKGGHAVVKTSDVVTIYYYPEWK